MKTYLLCIGVPLGLFVYALFKAFVFFFDGTTAVQSWNALCRIEACEEFPDYHMTYEVDGTHYYYPAGNYYSYLPLGVVSREGILRPTFRRNHPSREVYVNWRVLDFDLYLETEENDTFRRGFARVREDTEIMRFGHGLNARLPKYFDIDTTHPSGELTEFNFFISSKNSALKHFRLSNHIHDHRLYHSRTGTPATEVPQLLKSFVNRDDLRRAEFESFNDAFWLVSSEFDGNYITNHVAVVSKEPLLHDRHVYGVCRSQCWFYPIRFSDDPPNDAPLVAVQMWGVDMAVLRRGPCETALECDLTPVNTENMRLRFGVVEQVVEALKARPS